MTNMGGMINKISAHPIKRIAFVGNYMPRQCGIATFTTDLADAITDASDELSSFVVAVTDTEEGYDYPERVRLELKQEDLSSYHRAAEFLNLSDIDVLCVQHEYGIYGGPTGSHIITLLREVRMPVVTTLHTVLENPDPAQRDVLKEIVRLSDRLVVMSKRAIGYLQSIYGVPKEKIDFIPHGIPDVAFVDPNFYKDKFGVEGKTVLLTFGLLSPNKGIENVINALPSIIEEYPDVVYMVLGATHPHVIRDEGEKYRHSLEQLARTNGVEDKVLFVNKFVSLEDLVEYIGAADIYITPYLNPQQIVSGTLAYTVGAGKAVVSTPYWYAEEVLESERGLLAISGSSDSIAEQVLYLLNNEAERHAMRKRAYIYGREMIWPRVAEYYLETFDRARRERLHRPRTPFASQWLKTSIASLPPLNLEHLWRMTDNTGLLQHAVYTIPNYSEGYTTDDNARALMLTVLLEDWGEDWERDTMLLGPRYLAFLWHAFNPRHGRFRNFFGYDRNWLEEIGSADSHGRAIHALGLILGRSEQENLRGVALRLFEAALPGAPDLSGPRPWAFSILGIHEYLRRFSEDRMAQQVLYTLAEGLFTMYKAHAKPEWPWFENDVTYSNATLSHALLVSGHRLSRPDMLEAALTSLQWLINEQRGELGYFTPIGCQGFYRCGEEKARFDQQPVEAQCLISACLEAWHITKDPQWLAEAEWCFGWFLGQNDLGLPVYDPVSGGCHDGLHPDRLNKNEGAESTIAFLYSLLELRGAQRASSPSTLLNPITSVTNVTNVTSTTSAAVSKPAPSPVLLPVEAMPSAHGHD
jgi:glycosyltransferase involved in cell wall biosynthesis